VTRIRKIRWIGWALPIISGAIIYADLASGHIAKSMVWTVVALALATFGLGLYIWASTTPGEPVFMFSSRKPSLRLSAVFFGALTVCAVVLVKITFFDPQRNWWKDFRSAVFSIVMLVTYWVFITLVRYLRDRGRNSTDIQMKVGNSQR
jgi:hypothetical protein